MSTISKSEMLAAVVESGERPFRLRFVRATGKLAGQVREAVCYYGMPNPKDRQAPTQGEQRRKARTSHLESNTLPLTEFSTRGALTPFISHIISFNGQKVIH